MSIKFTYFNKNLIILFTNILLNHLKKIIFMVKLVAVKRENKI